MSVRNEKQQTALFSYCCGFSWWWWHTKIKSNCMSSSCLSPSLSSPVSEGDVWVSPAKKEVAFLREKHLHIREGKWSCLIHAYPVSFPSLICSTEFSLLDFLSFTVLRANARGRQRDLSNTKCPEWLQITEVISKSLKQPGSQGMEFDFPSLLLPSAELWGLATRKVICCAINLQKNILFGLLLRDASRNWKPWVTSHDMSVSVCLEDVVLLCLHVCVCYRVNLCTQVKHCLLHTLHRKHYFKKDLKQRHLLYWNYWGILYVQICKQL